MKTFLKKRYNFQNIPKRGIKLPKSEPRVQIKNNLSEILEFANCTKKQYTETFRQNLRIAFFLEITHWKRKSSTTNMQN